MSHCEQEQPSLEALALAAQRGDQASFDELARRVDGPLRAFLRQRVADPADADDLAQETLLRAYEKLDLYDPGRPFSTWLYTIGKRLAANRRDADRRRERLASAAGSSSEMRTEMPAPADLWLRARRVLSDEQYRALWLRYVQGFSVAEVAGELRRTSVSTRVLLHRARKRLVLEVEPS